MRWSDTHFEPPEPPLLGVLVNATALGSIAKRFVTALASTAPILTLWQFGRVRGIGPTLRNCLS